jgi:hypothetical protein
VRTNACSVSTDPSSLRTDLSSLRTDLGYPRKPLNLSGLGWAFLAHESLFLTHGSLFLAHRSVPCAEGDGKLESVLSVRRRRTANRAEGDLNRAHVCLGSAGGWKLRADGPRFLANECQKQAAVFEKGVHGTEDLAGGSHGRARGPLIRAGFAVLRAGVYVFRARVRSVRADGTPSQRAIELNPKRVRAFLGVSEASRRAGKTREAERRQQKGKFRCYRASA